MPPRHLIGASPKLSIGNKGRPLAADVGSLGTHKIDSIADGAHLLAGRCWGHAGLIAHIFTPIRIAIASAEPK